ncbi:MAG: hypothetical protein H7145_15735 [Akkermansiaceae bacterium]|nr:hypothetical protein [Armatimonadota bacterium]
MVYSPSSRRPSILTVVWYSLAAAVVLATLSYVFFQEHLTSRRRVCYSNLRRIGQSLQMYAEDYDGNYPLMSLWWDENRSRAEPLPGCPSTEAIPSLDDNHPGLVVTPPAIPGYAYNSLLNATMEADGTFKPVARKAIRYPATTVCVCEESADTSMTLHANYRKRLKPPPGREDGSARHDGGANYLFCDGHVQWYKPEAVRGVEEMIVGRERHPDGKTPDFLLN